jgi:hypothetical protein
MSTLYGPVQEHGCKGRLFLFRLHTFLLLTLIVSKFLSPSEAAEPIEDRMVASALGNDWTLHWNRASITRFVGVVTYSQGGNAAFSFDRNDLVITPAAAIVAWLEPGQTLQCSRYAFWLQSDGKKANFISKFFGGHDEKPKSNPGSPLPIHDDVASPKINIASDDPAGWPDGRPDRLTLVFRDSTKPIVYLGRGNGKLVAGDVQFAYASPQIIAQPFTDTLEPLEPNLHIDGGTAGEVKARGEFKHVHRLPTSPLPPVKIHILIIEPKTKL